jgi:heat shock protein HtpX
LTGTNLFEQQKKNLRRTTSILAGFVAFLVFLGIGADFFLYGSGAGPGFPVATIGALLFGAGSSLWALKAGDRAVLESANAVPIDRSDPRQRILDNVVEEMAIAGGLPKPAVYVIPDRDPNAFATGSGPEKSSVAVTAGLLVGSVLLISDWGRRGLGWGGGRRRSSRDGGGGGVVMLVFLVLWVVSLVLAPLIARLVAMAVSREREYLADASGSELTRNPQALASALEKIDAAKEPTPSIKQGVAHLCIADPRGRLVNEREGGLAELFATHPPIAKRIALLRQMAYQVR